MIKRLMKIGNLFRDSFTVVDMSTSARLCIYVNEVFCQSTGYSFEESVGRNLAFLQGSLTSKETVHFMRDSFKKNLACVQDIINYKKDGTPFLNRLLMIPYQSTANSFYLGFQNDITEKRGLIHSNESLIKVKDSEIRHMINNPLAIILGKLETSPLSQGQDKNEDELMKMLEANLSRINYCARNFDSISELENFKIF